MFINSQNYTHNAIFKADRPNDGDCSTGREFGFPTGLLGLMYTVILWLHTDRSLCTVSTVPLYASNHIWSHMGKSFMFHWISYYKNILPQKYCYHLWYGAIWRQRIPADVLLHSIAQHSFVMRPNSNCSCWLKGAISLLLLYSISTTITAEVLKQSITLKLYNLQLWT